MWELRDPKIYYIEFDLDPQQFSNDLFSKTEKGFGVGLETVNVQEFHPLFDESDLPSLFHPLSAISLKEITLSGWKWCHEMSQKRSNHTPVHDIQLGRRKYTFPAREVTFSATFENSFILLFHC